MVERLTRFADARARRAEAAVMRKLNLDPAALSRQTRAAMGGPFEAISPSGNGEIDPRFERLGLSLSRMAVLERALDGIPQVVPATVENITSGFGYRRDPLNLAAQRCIRALISRARLARRSLPQPRAASLLPGARAAMARWWKSPTPMA